MLSVQEREIILQKVWKHKKYDTQKLITRSGKKLEVLYTGIENFDGGPDFKEAIIKISGLLLKGDIEIHLEDTGWYSHNHQTDPKYNRVMLHVVSEYSSNEYFIEREDGVKVEQICIPISEEEIDLWKKENKKSPLKSDSVRIIDDCPLSKCSPDKIWATIEAAGIERFYDKTEQIKELRLNHEWDQILYEKVMEALGYSKNQKQFCKLAHIVPFEILQSEMQWVNEDSANLRCAALLFGAAGLLPSQEDTLTLESHNFQYVEQLKNMWHEMTRRLNLTSMSAADWQFFRLRPQNFPTRRIAGVTKLLNKFSREGFLIKLIKIIDTSSNDSRKIQNELEKLFCQKSDGFWKLHYTFADSFSSQKQPGNEYLIGKSRSRDIIINIVLPILYSYASEADDRKLETIIFEVLKRYPPSENNSIIKSMKMQLFKKDGKNEKKSKIKASFQQQGLIQLYKLYCKNMECRRCLKLHAAEL